MRIPPLLKTGDKITIVAPAKKIQISLEPSIEIIKSWGLDPVLGQHLFDTNNYFAGTDQDRKSDLQWALDDPEIKAIIIARGGYGTSRILDEISWEGFENHPKWICGFSDITSLITLLDNKATACIHGPMAVTLDWDETSSESLRSLLFEGKLAYHLPSHSNNTIGKCDASLIGGNLSIICNSIGTSSEINTDGKILFLEEVGEYLYHLDRMLIQLKRAGKLDAIKGLIIGDFSSMKDHQDSFGKNVNEIIADHFSHLDIPVAYGFPLGHEKKNLPVICGVNVQFEVTEQGTVLKCRV